jgi:hypothetical protein
MIVFLPIQVKETKLSPAGNVPVNFVGFCFLRVSRSSFELPSRCHQLTVKGFKRVSGSEVRRVTPATR